MPGRLRSFAHDGLCFDVLDHGPATGEVVVCLHGFPQDASAYDAVWPGLAAAGHRVLAPHQRGYSAGARPPDVAAYTLDLLVGDVLALLDAAGCDRADVVGHDWGGAVAWALAASHAERVRSLTVLSTPHPAALRASLRDSSQALRSGYMAALQVPIVPEAVLSAGGGRLLRPVLTSSGLPAEFAARYAARLGRPEAVRGALAWYRALRSSSGRRAPVGRVHVPTTYLHGRRDPFFAPRAVRRSREYVDAPFVDRELAAGHWLPETCGQEVAGSVLRQIDAVR